MSFYLDIIAGDDYTAIDRIRESERREGPCDDDCESTAPFVGMMPEESDHEGGSPLDFSHIPSRDWEVFAQLGASCFELAAHEEDFSRLLKEGV